MYIINKKNNIVRILLLETGNCQNKICICIKISNWRMSGFYKRMCDEKKKIQVEKMQRDQKKIQHL